MISLKFLHDTPFDMFEGAYKLAMEIYGRNNVVIALDESIDPAHIKVEIYGAQSEEAVEDDLKRYSHWFTAEAVE